MGDMAYYSEKKGDKAAKPAKKKKGKGKKPDKAMEEKENYYKSKGFKFS